MRINGKLIKAFFTPTRSAARASAHGRQFSINTMKINTNLWQRNGTAGKRLPVKLPITTK